MSVNMGRFWISDEFIRVHAKELSCRAQIVYVALACYANAHGQTFVGCRRLAEDLSMSKNTVNKAIRELKASQMVEQLGQYQRGEVSRLQINTVPGSFILPYQLLGPKEVLKEVSKEGQKQKIEKLKKMKTYYGIG